MIMQIQDTILAPATSGGRSGIGIIRISGINVVDIINIVLKVSIKERYAYYLPFFDLNGNIIDYGIVLFFMSPKSFTGEDMLELQGHGNPIILDLLIKNILSIQNVRFARPGEFSERAFLNGKIDLVQAEAVMDLIQAESVAAVNASLKSLQGSFSCIINKIFSNIKKIYTDLEVLINFSDDINDNINLTSINYNLKSVINLIQKIQKKSLQSYILRNGIKIVITGLPNVGKSSLLNKLLNKEVAIVTDIPGTTRDILRSTININGLSYELIDTAGLCNDSTSIVEKLGINLAKKLIKKSNYIFLVLDITKKKEINDIIILKYIKKLKKNQNLTIIFNKIDIVQEKSRIGKYNNYVSFFISTKFNLGIDLLKDHIQKFSKLINNSENLFLARRRHIEILTKVLKVLKIGQKNWIKYQLVDCLSDDIRLAIQLISEITGQFTHNDLLKKIFSKFCIGK